MDSLKVHVGGLAAYRGREGQLAFMGHRLAGLGTLLFLAIHILDTATVYFFPSLYSHAIEIYRSTPMMIGEIMLVAAVIFHGVNGVRIAVFDLWFPHLWEYEPARKTAIWTFVITIILWLPAAFLMLRSLLEHNYGVKLFGG